MPLAVAAITSPMTPAAQRLERLPMLFRNQTPNGLAMSRGA